MSVSSAARASVFRTILAPLAITWFSAALVFPWVVAAGGFNDEANSTPDNARTDATDVCRVRFQGPQPDVVSPPSYIIDVPLPTMYCDNVDQWVLIYPDRDGLQFYRLDPARGQSYPSVMGAASTGKITPWALRRTHSGEPVYLINLDREDGETFDYIVSSIHFDVCLELATSPRVASQCMGSVAIEKQSIRD